MAESLIPFGLAAACEYKSVEPGKSKLWASLRVDPQGKALEAERAPLAVVLVVDTSGSMQGDPLHHVLSSCELLGDLLDARDQLAIVTFADHAGIRCGLTGVDPMGRLAIKAALKGVVANGSTNMHGGIEVAAGVLITAPPGLRRVMVVMSDGQPNIGIASADGLAGYVRSLKLAVSTLGFGLHHDENVLDAVATAGSGRYAYIPDPMIARVDLARAALAHGGVVADQLELRIKLEAGVELLQILPPAQLRHGGSGVATALGDVFVDEGRLVAVELQLDLKTSARGRLAEIVVEGRSPDGVQHRQVRTLDVDIRVGAPVVDREAQRDVIIVQADGARVAARAQADRGAHPAAATILRAMVARIDTLGYFVRNDGSVLAELYEQLIDEAANYERKSSDLERAHQRKASTAYKSVSASAGPPPRVVQRLPPIPGWLLGLNHSVAGQKFQLYMESSIGRSSSSDVVVTNASLSRCHARILFITDHYVIQDMGTTNGTRVNGQIVRSAVLASNDDIQFGDVQFRFVLGPRP